MSDITMCAGEREGIMCQKRVYCRRHTSLPSGWQSWFAVPPFAEDRCEKFISNGLEKMVGVTVSSTEGPKDRPAG